MASIAEEYRDGLILEFGAAKLATEIPSVPHFQLIRGWLATCNESHPRCRMNNRGIANSQRFPTRLVNIQKAGDETANLTFTLVITAEHYEVDEYVTLSHCWGGGTSFTLKSENLEAMKRGLHVSRLPKTFQDAMRIALELGYRYIWIDSLCIVQNSADDWRRESRLMAGVYGNAVLNIAALGGSGDAGCFRTRSRPLGRLPCKIRSTRNSTLFAQMSEKDLDFYGPDMKQSVLLSRAWVVQERLLSKRNIFFHGPELALDCCTAQFSETHPRGKNHPNAEKLPVKTSMYLILEHITNTSRVSPDDAKLIFESLWVQVVTDYSAAELTKEEDRAVALQGVVDLIQARTNNRWTYIAGLWREFLPVQLLWSSAAGEPYDRQNLVRPPGRPYPSWSWWALQHPGGVHYRVADPHTREFVRCTKLLYQSRILEPDIAGGSPTDPPGFLTQSILRLTGYLRRENVRVTSRELWLDYKLEEEIVTLMLVSLYELEEVGPEPFKYFESGLVLLPRRGGEGYIRVGNFHHFYPRNFRDVLFTGNPHEESEVLLY
jgi:hypothetical protein